MPHHSRGCCVLGLLPLPPPLAWRANSPLLSAAASLQEDDKKAQLASGRLRLSKLPNATWRVLCVLKSLQRLVPAAR